MNFFEYSGCPVCKSKKFIKKHRIEYTSKKTLSLLGIENSPDIYLNRCNNCHHHFANPRIKSELMDRYYSEINSEYYVLSDSEPKDNLKNEHKRIVRLVERYRSEGNILEIGTGYGHLLKKFGESRWIRYGVEPSPHAAGIAKRVSHLNVINSFFSDQTFSGIQFDVILMFDLIEHLSNPGQMLQRIEFYLKPGGIIVIGTGNIKSLNARISGSNWSYFGSYEHISFFSIKSLTFLLRGNGWQVNKIIKTSYRGNPLSNITRVLENGLKRIPLTFIDRYHYKLPLAMDHMIIIARKNA